MRNDQFRAAAANYENQSPDESPSIYEDEGLLSEALCIEPDWLSDAICYALSQGDWEYAKRQIDKHSDPIIRAYAESLKDVF